MPAHRVAHGAHPEPIDVVARTSPMASIAVVCSATLTLHFFLSCVMVSIKSLSLAKRLVIHTVAPSIMFTIFSLD